MMDLEETFHVAGPMVISETIENETVIIDLDHGAYYSLTGSGPFVWGLLDSPRTVSNIIDAVSTGLSADRKAAEAAVLKLLSYLTTEGLVNRTSAENVPVPDEVISAAKNNFGAFTSPEIKKFTDMEAMLLLDPIHDVDEQGWPHPRPASDTDNQ